MASRRSERPRPASVHEERAVGVWLQFFHFDELNVRPLKIRSLVAVRT